MTSQAQAQHHTGPHPLREQPSPEVAACLRGLGASPDDLLLCTSTDIDLLGNYRVQWLAATSDTLYVITDGAEPQVDLQLPIRTAKEYRTQTGVGSGLLQAQIDGTIADLLRFSNRRAYYFEKVARKLDQYLHGKPIELHPEDAIDPKRCQRCGLMLDVAGQGCPRCVDRGAVLLRMWRLMRPYRTAALGILGLLVIGIGLDLVSPQLTRYLVDNVLPGGATELAAVQEPARLERHLSMLLVVVLVLAAVQVLRMGVNLINGQLSNRIGTAITFDMRGRLVSHLQQLSISYFERQQVGSLVARVAHDTEALHGFVNQMTGGFILQVLMLIGVGIMMIATDPKLALFALIPAPFVVGGTIVFWRYIYPRNYRTWDASSKQAGLLAGVLTGMRVVKAFGQERREVDRFHGVSRRLRDTRRNVDGAMATFNPIMGIVFQLGGWIVWYIGGRDVIGGRLSLGELMAFFGYLWMFYGPLATLPQFTNWLTTFITQAHRVFEVLDTPAQLSEPAEPVRVGALRGEIKFEGVTFGYSRHTPVLRDFNLEVSAGETLGLVGRSGSGKSTVASLVARLYDADEGRVLIDGIDVRDLPKDALRAQVGVVLQEPFLFRGSICDNLAYGRPRAQPEEILAAARAAQCHDFIARRAHAYETWVGEHGAGLSGGEKQRIGIARVLLTDPRILILDEPTSSVDTEGEAAITAALRELCKGRTTLAIAHRLSTLRNADRIVVLDRGRVVEAGTHEELAQRKGRYFRLLKLQQGQLLAGGAQGQPAPEGASAAAPDAEAAPVPEAEPEGPLPPIRGHRLRWLTPELARIHLGTFNTLHVTVREERIYGGVFALRCLPISHPREYISLRYVHPDGHELEVGLIRRLDDWPEDVQQLVRQSLMRRYFVHTIRGINQIEQISQYLDFEVETDLGPQHFVLRWQSDRALDYGPHGKMLLDTDDNRYLIPDLSTLPERDRRLFERYIYW